MVPRAALATGHPSDEHVTAYYGVAPSILDGLIDRWQRTQPPWPISCYTFLDAGAGKGRALLAASLHPFEEVVGVELNPGLAEIARHNLESFLQHEAESLSPVRVLTGDVLEVVLPYAPVAAFLFNPFEAPLLQSFLERVRTEFRHQPNGFDLLYVNAEHGAVIDAFGGFERVFHGMVPMSGEDHLADLAEIAEQTEYGSTGDELCTIYRWRGLPGLSRLRFNGGDPVSF